MGFAQNAGLILGGSISQSNFLGTGNKVSVGLTKSDYQTRYNFGFVDPYWTPDGVSLGYNAFYRKTDYSKLNVDISDYSVDSYGAGMSIGYPISETSRLTYGLTAQRDSINPGAYTVDEIFDFIEKQGDTFTNYKASIGWSESTLNKGVLATRGHSQSLVLETTVPGSDLSFYKLDYRGQLFTPLTSTYTMRFHTELGYGDGYGSTDRLPFLRETITPVASTRYVASRTAPLARAVRRAWRATRMERRWIVAALTPSVATPTRTRIRRPSVVT